jgi:hypothetical protein
VTKTKGHAEDGRCCSCGYGGEKETPCKKRTDRTHCIHWWESPCCGAHLLDDPERPSCVLEKGHEGAHQWVIVVPSSEIKDKTV